jgi:metal-sulfur cluster biosynthetic enzyme
MYSKELILRLLSKVTHPEKGKDLVTLGMISDIEIVNNEISITVTPE